MRSWWIRFALSLLILGPITASAADSPRVLLAIPGTDGSAIARFTLRFSDPMAPVGGGSAPIAMKCAVRGEGRWVDPTTFVHEFASPLPGGISCRAELRAGLATLDGREVGGTRSFTIDSGGPYARALLPSEGRQVEEDQAFFVAANGPVDRASVASGAYCTVDGIGERIPVDLLPARAVDEVLLAMGDNWRRRSFLEEAGIAGDLPEAADERATALANIVALKCRRPLPPGRDMALVWDGNIRSPAGRKAGDTKRFDFSVRQEFSARLSCSRVNPQSGCNPLETIRVQFSAPVPRAQALAVRLDAGGRLLTPIDDERSETLSQVEFAPPLPPAITARLLLPTELRDESGRVLSNARRFPLPFEIAATPPLVKFAAPFGILEASEGGVLPVTVRGVEPELRQGIKAVAGGTARIEASDGVIADWVRRVEKSQEYDVREEGEGKARKRVNHTGDTSVFRTADTVDRMALPLPGKGKEFEVIGIPLSRPGFYVVELASPQLGRVLMDREATRYVAAAALVTDMSVHFKWGRAASLVWVTSLAEGKPVAGAAVAVTDSCSGQQLASGTTDKAGRLLVRGGLPEPTTRSSCEGDYDSPPLIISARKGEDYSFAMSNWGNGIRPYDFDLPYGWNEPEPIFHSILDRTLLRAGETVHMKHVYRAPTPTGLRSGGTQDGTLLLQHRGSETVFELPLKLGADGIGENEWTPPKGAATGDYDIRVKLGDVELYTGQSVRVDEYRLPTMRASVSGPRTPAVRPRQMPVDLYLGFLSGGGAPRAPVRVRTAFEPLYDRPEGWDGWSFGGRPVKEGTVSLDEDENDPGRTDLPAVSTTPLTLDANGAHRFQVDASALQDSARMTVEMDYQDANGETLTASAYIPIHGSAVRLGIRPDGWIQRSTDLRLKLAAIGLDGRPIRGQRVDVAIYTREILSSRRRLIGGFYAYDNSARTTRIDASCSDTTDKLGLAECRLDPDVSGEVIAVATTRDRDGNEARAVTYVYLAGNDDWWFGGDNGDRMDIIPDAKSYRAGDTAKIQVRMPFRKATALVTVEREGVMHSFVTELSGKDPVVKVKLDGSYSPDTFVSVMAVRGRIAKWRVLLAELGQRYNLPFLDPKLSNPTALVDLAKPSYRVGIAQIRVGWESHELKVAVKADRERYNVRETAQVAVQVRGPNRKPVPSAEIAFAAVDEALLQLSPNDSWDILQRMMAERPLSVLTSTAQMQVVGKRHYGRKAVAAGGGGGGDLSALTRADFRPVLLWKGRVTLDARGVGRVSVPMADSLSSYKLVAIATDGGELFGTGSMTVRTVQQLTIYSGVPPLVRSGDQYAATFTLRNGTDRPMTVAARAELRPVPTPGSTSHVRTVTVVDPQTVTVPAGGATPVTWRVTAPEDAEALRWTVSAATLDGKASDRIQVDEQVIPAVPEEVIASFFSRIAPGTSIPLASPAGALPGRGRVEVRLTTSPAPALEGVREYMRWYPYGCFEQRLSKIVALDDREAWDRLMAALPTYIASDGLLRYWPSDTMEGSIALTAYALSITAEAGLPWPDESRERLLNSLKSVVDGRLEDEAEGPADRRLLRLASLAALARNGAATPAMVGQAAIPVADMPTSTLADWLMTLDKVGGTAQRRRAAETALRSRIVYEGTRLDLVDRRVAPWWMMVSDDEMALKALMAVAGRRGWDADAPRMMIGVALRQTRGHWDTTPANAWGTIATRKFAAAFPGAVTGVTTAKLETRALRHKWGDAAAPMLFFSLPAAKDNLLLSHDSAPRPFAFVTMRAAVPLTAPAFAGSRVSRTVTFLERQRPDRISRGDVLTVRITVEAPVDRTWVVIEDPIPAGASIISGVGGQSALFAAQASGGDAWPSYIERGLDAWRAYFGWLPQGRSSVEYALRINGDGRFLLSPTRVEAMYSPEIHAALPNAPLVVSP
jgi:uncharacterized protein YfaS (alpha-2-macroglobulin family)